MQPSQVAGRVGSLAGQGVLVCSAHEVCAAVVLRLAAPKLVVGDALHGVVGQAQERQEVGICMEDS